MTIRTSTTLSATTAALLAGTACGASPEAAETPATDLDGWASDTLPAADGTGFSVAGITGSDGGRSTIEVSGLDPGWYAITIACTPTDSGTGSARLTLSGERGTYGEGDCSTSPVTTTTYLGASDDAPPETITVTGEAQDGEFFWGASASPTTAPE
ncbi:hypothetical protein [Kocuria nitroreducens]|uniref:hypothetical protein n=1 Tax=Kocuria nitroreducens TaxID=3058914 RepID=UPI0036DD3710